MASVHCHIHYYSPTLFSRVQVYASESTVLVFFFFPQQPKWTPLLNYRETKGRVDKMVLKCENKQ